MARIADTHYGTPKRMSGIPCFLDVSDDIQLRYGFNLQQILTYIYAHRVDQYSNATAALMKTGDAHIGNLGKS